MLKDLAREKDKNTEKEIPKMIQVTEPLFVVFHVCVLGRKINFHSSFIDEQKRRVISDRFLFVFVPYFLSLKKG